MKVYFETKAEAKKAISSYAPTDSVFHPQKKDLRIFKFGKGARSYFVGTSDELFYARVHGITPKRPRGSAKKF